MSEGTNVLNEPDDKVHVPDKIVKKNRTSENIAVVILKLTYEPRHDKTNKMSVRSAKTHISLGIRPV